MMTVHEHVDEMVRALGGSESDIPAEALELAPDQYEALVAGTAALTGEAGELARQLLQRWDAMTATERVSALLVLAAVLSQA